MITKEFPAEDNSLASAVDFVTEQLENAGATMKQVMQITVAFEELFVNIAHYAYGKNGGTASIGVDADSEEIIIVLKDNGIPFNPFEREDPDVTLSAEDREIGGLGIFMTKKIMDSYEYEFKDGYNIVTLKKSYK